MAATPHLVGTAVLGVDLSTESTKTGAAVLVVEDDRIAVEIIAGKVTDDVLVELAHGVDLVGVDAPLGWPEPFLEAVILHQAGKAWPPTNDAAEQRRRLSKRNTDRAIKKQVGIDPLSVSADRIGAVAMRCARLQTLWAAHWGRLEDRAGSGRLVETYPAAALNRWGLTHQSYKGKDKAEAREALVTSILVEAPWIDIIGGPAGICLSDHCLDAVISGLIALAAKAGLTFRLQEGDEAFRASQEGWIHLPSCSLTGLGRVLRGDTPEEPEGVGRERLLQAIVGTIQKRREWVGTAAWLLELIDGYAPEPKPAWWPRSSVGLGSHLQHLVGPLQDVGLEIEYWGSGEIGGHGGKWMLAVKDRGRYTMPTPYWPITVTDPAGRQTIYHPNGAIEVFEADGPDPPSAV